MDKSVFESYSQEDTFKIANDFSKQLKAGDVICFYGDLGAGKTSFVKGLAEGIGIEEYITSPTFTIMNQYDGRLTLYHFDVYRVSDSDELYEIGWDEFVYGDGVSVIEWAELVEDILPDKRYNITIEKGEDDNYRKITIGHEA